MWLVVSPESTAEKDGGASLCQIGRFRSAWGFQECPDLAVPQPEVVWLLLDELAERDGRQPPLAALGQVVGALGVLNDFGQLRKCIAFPLITRILSLEDSGRQRSCIPNAGS